MWYATKINVKCKAKLDLACNYILKVNYVITTINNNKMNSLNSLKVQKQDVTYILILHLFPLYNYYRETDTHTHTHTYICLNVYLFAFFPCQSFPCFINVFLFFLSILLRYILVLQAECIYIYKGRGSRSRNSLILRMRTFYNTPYFLITLFQYLVIIYPF